MFCQKIRIEYTGIVVQYTAEWKVPKYRRWTKATADCYRRGCRCGITENFDECPNLKYCTAEHANFIIKEVVRRMVAELGTERIESDLQRALEEEDADLFL